MDLIVDFVCISNFYFVLRHVSLYPYKPQKSDELELKRGQLYMVTECCKDGWYKGTSLKTNCSGVFPGNYVTPAK